MENKNILVLYNYPSHFQKDKESYSSDLATMKKDGGWIKFTEFFIYPFRSYPIKTFCRKIMKKYENKENSYLRTGRNSLIKKIVLPNSLEEVMTKEESLMHAKWINIFDFQLSKFKTLSPLFFFIPSNCYLSLIKRRFSDRAYNIRKVDKIDNNFFIHSIKTIQNLLNIKIDPLKGSPYPSENDIKFYKILKN